MLILLKNIFKFWLDTKNVDGFRIDALKHLFESKGFENEPMSRNNLNDILNAQVAYNDLNHIYSANQRETFEILSEWRSYCNLLGKKKNSVKALIVEATYSDVKEIRPYYVYNNKPAAHFPFNFQLTSIEKKADFKPTNLKELINDFERSKPNAKCWSNWQIGNHDCTRAASRFGAENVDLANTLNLLLGGTAIIYNGEEIGMEDLPKNVLKFEDSQDEFGKRHGPENFSKYSRDYQRSPMQWNSSKNAGFTKSDNTWLPINPNYSYLNVQVNKI